MNSANGITARALLPFLLTRAESSSSWCHERGAMHGAMHERRIDGKLDDYTGSKINGRTSVVVTKAMGEGAIEGVLADYAINRADPFSTAFKYSRFGLKMANPRNTSALSGKKRKIFKVKGIPASASMEHDITDAMAESSTAAA